MSKKKQIKQNKHKAPTRKASAEPAVDASLEVNAEALPAAAAASSRVKSAKGKPDVAKSVQKAGTKRAAGEATAEGVPEPTLAGKGASAKPSAAKAGTAKAKTAKPGTVKASPAKASATKASAPQRELKAATGSPKSKRAQPAAQATPAAPLASKGEVPSLSFADSPFAEGGAEVAPDAAEPSVVEETRGKSKASKASRKRGAQQVNADEVPVEVAADAPAPAEPELAADAQLQADEPEAAVDVALVEDEWAEEADEAGAIAASLLEQEPGAEHADPDEPELSDEETNQRYLKGLIEALLFSAEKPLTLRELARGARLDKKRTTELLKEVTRDFRKRGMNVVEIAGGFGFRSNPAYAPYVQKLLSLRPVRLSRAQLETLAVIAYRQPVTRPEVDDVRGVDSGQVIKGLLDRDLIKMLGKKDEVGRPMLYGTTPAFLELFSLESLKDLPNLREFTELSDDSREKLKDAMGEAAPGGVGEPGATDASSVTAEDADGEVAEPPVPEVSLAGTLDNEVPSSSDVEFRAEVETADESELRNDAADEPELDMEASDEAEPELEASEEADPDVEAAAEATPDEADEDLEASEGALLDSEPEVESDSLG